MSRAQKRHLTKAETQIVATLIDNPGLNVHALAELMNTTKGTITQHFFNLRRKGVALQSGYFVKVTE